MELLVEREGAGDTDDRRESTHLLSPEVGWLTRVRPKGDLVGPGEDAGTLLTLGVSRRLVFPPGVTGRVASPTPSRLRHPVGYGDVIYVVERIAPDQAATEASVEAQAPPTDAFLCPQAGRFYGRPAPGDPPFLAVGDVVEEGATVGLIEIMKTFTQIVYRRGDTLPARARVTRILVDDEAEVAAGQPLFEIEGEQPLPG
jgi:acetyl-CoA carboxylase biotin carboxyl carrier protein